MASIILRSGAKVGLHGISLRLLDSKRCKDDKEASQNPDNVKLNLMVEGSGPVWINDIRLEKVGL